MEEYQINEFGEIIRPSRPESVRVTDEREEKLKKAKELIVLSEKEDKEISDLESQIYERGIEVDE